MNTDAVSIATIVAEIEDCKLNCEKFGWEISEINSSNLSFTVKLVSPIDMEIFLITIDFKNYPEWPLLIEFTEPDTTLVGTKRAYPLSKKFGHFFHSYPCICHPASRKAYTGYSDVHKDWSMSSWKQNPQVGSLLNLNAILEAIYFRINNEEVYDGRMK
jgi:hypothetical protein